MSNSNNGLSPRYPKSMRASPNPDASRLKSPAPSTSSNAGAGTTPQLLHASLPQRPVVSSTSANNAALPPRHRHASPSATSGRGRGRGSLPNRPGNNGDHSTRRSTADDTEEQEKRARKLLAFGEDVYSVSEDSIREDWSLNYLNTGRRPQNLLQGTKLEERFSEYPKLAKLLAVHSELVKSHACPPTYLSLPDLRTQPSTLPTTLLPTKFDCVLLDLPLAEYAQTYPSRFASPDSEGDTRPVAWSWDEIADLPIPQIASNPGFIWLWVGAGKANSKTRISGLDRGRDILAKWGYRRCEDIVWLKTNVKKAEDGKGLSREPPTSTLMTHTKEHCLMGIRGTVRRSTDGHFVHCNVDTDVIVWEGDESDPLSKPPELYNMIENFCMGTRRLEICSNARNARPGWLTVGAPPAQQDSTAHIYDKQVFDAYFVAEASKTGSNLVPTTAEVESLRPRSPGPPGGASKGAATAGGSLMPGMKSNPQGIGRHTNRSATPSASQQLEMQQIQAQQMAEMERQRQFAEQQKLVQQQQQQMQMQQQQLQMQQQQWTMQQAQFMGMFQPGNNPMAMGMMPQMGMGMMGMPNPYAAMGMPFQQMQQFPQLQQQQQQQQGFPQQQGFAGSMGHMQGGMNGQYSYGHGPNKQQQYRGGQQQ